MLKAFKQDVQVALTRSVERDDRSTLVLDVLAQYMSMFTTAMLKPNLNASQQKMKQQVYELPAIIFEAARIIGTHHDYNREKIKEANERMIQLYRISLDTAMRMNKS